jgi:putative peptide zinc metalloprotease protein
MAELAVAAIAAIVWANTSTGTLHIIAYNVIFVASVSTLLFNGNPLLRFDAYYVLSDLVEIPNLSQRSRNYLYYLVKRYSWGLQKAQNPAYSYGEGAWLAFYGVASITYRIFICVRILMFLNDRLPEELFILVPLLAFAAIVAWVFVPLGKFVRFLATGAELARRRARAVGSTVGGLCLMVISLAVIQMPDHWRVEGIVEPVRLAIVHAEADGFVTGFLPSESEVSPGGQPLIRAVNPELQAERKGLVAERRALQVQRRLAEMQEIAAAQILDEQIDALNEKMARVDSDLASLNIAAPLAGTWVAPDIEHTRGVYVQRGERIGFVGSLDHVIIRATAGQSVAAMLWEQAHKDVEIRVKGRPDAMLAGEIDRIFPAGHELLPSEALGYAVGGSMPTLTQDPRGTRAAENFFEIRIKPEANRSVRLLAGQRIIARIRMRPKPLLLQWWQSARQLFQRRFRI